MIGTANLRTIYSFNKALLTNKKQDFEKMEIITKKEIIATINRCKKGGYGIQFSATYGKDKDATFI